MVFMVVSMLRWWDHPVFPYYLPTLSRGPLPSPPLCRHLDCINRTSSISQQHASSHHLSQPFMPIGCVGGCTLLSLIDTPSIHIHTPKHPHLSQQPLLWVASWSKWGKDTDFPFCKIFIGRLFVKASNIQKNTNLANLAQGLVLSIKLGVDTCLFPPWVINTGRLCLSLVMEHTAVAKREPGGILRFVWFSAGKDSQEIITISSCFQNFRLCVGLNDNRRGKL